MTLLPEVVEDMKPSDAELLRRIKSIFYMRIRIGKVTDEEIMELIKKVHSGTRNIHYLVKRGEGTRVRDIAEYIIREIGW